MPTLSRWFVRSGMFYLVAALMVGVPLVAGPALGVPGEIRLLWPTWIHALTVGWLTQLIFGVAYWMFPRYSRERPRGSGALGWWTFALLNLGLFLRVIFEPLATFGFPAGAWLVLSALLQLAAGVAFAFNTWPRTGER
jgi:hypothetical protein